MNANRYIRTAIAVPAVFAGIIPRNPLAIIATKRIGANDMLMPELASYDLILINTSADKDSQAMLDYLMELVRQNGVAERVVAVHCDLGRVEWQGTRALAERQVAHYGVRFEVVSRPQGDLLNHVESRGMWPSSAARYCTSDHKRGQVYTLLTKLTGELRQTVGDRQVRILNCMGLRAQESPARAKRVAFQHDKKASNGKRHVDTWLPIHAWTVEQVWQRIAASGVEHHYAYDLGMPRLSCCFCIFAPRPALILAGQHNPELLAQYVAVEERIRHTFRPDQTLVEIQAAVRAGEQPQASEIRWIQCA